MRTFLLVLTAASTVALGYFLANTSAADPAAPGATPIAAPVPQPPQSRLVAHEWGTFTSFSASDGVPIAFTPNYTDLPHFVYYPPDSVGKGGRFVHGGLVSMETPVLYFYTDRETRLTVKVDFPQGWITEWYPYAHESPTNSARTNKGGQSIRWNVKLTPQESPRFPIDRDARTNHYYAARETDSAPLQTEVAIRKDADEYDYSERGLRGGTVLQREKFLFYRGVGTFAPPVTVKVLGSDKVRVTNSSGGRAEGLVLVTVRDGEVGFKPLDELENGATTEASIPVADGKRAQLGEFLVKQLTGAGLYEKEAKAMVKTWDSAWFGEEGTRLLYLVPRKRTDELLPLTMDPKPTELVRVLVGRHDFLTQGQEATAERELLRIRAAQSELNAGYANLQKLGRFTLQAQEIAQKRLDAKATPQK
jgi:hypothetical protein